MGSGRGRGGAPGRRGFVVVGGVVLLWRAGGGVRGVDVSSKAGHYRPTPSTEHDDARIAYQVEGVAGWQLGGFLVAHRAWAPFPSLSPFPKTKPANLLI